MLHRSLIILMVLAGCQPKGEKGAIERIEIRESGWESLDITLTKSGQGHFEQTGYLPPPIKKTFQISPKDFSKLASRLSEFRHQAVPRNEESLLEMTKRSCPLGVPVGYDMGGTYIRWVGKGFDEHFLADFGCDPQRMKGRNNRLSAIVQSLPLPKP
jgi:hypothetical protein